MNKKLLVSAVAVALSGPALAQNASLYGIVDVGLSKVSNAGLVLASGAQSTSRLGFTASEDLGEGLKAGFTLEARLEADAGQLGAPTSIATSASAQIFNRRSTLNLSGGFGEFRLGLDQNAYYDTTLGFDVTGDKLAGTSTVFNDFKSTTLDGNYSAQTGRNSNQVKYTSPTFAGFKVRASYAFAGSTAAESAASANSVSALALDYVQGNLAVSVANARRDNATASLVSKATYVGGSYDLGSFKVVAGYEKRGNELETVAGTKNAYLIGAAIPLNQTTRLNVSLTTQTFNDATAPNERNVMAQVIRDLSKRTSIYAQAASVSNSGGSTAAASDVETFQTGIVHRF